MGIEQPAKFVGTLLFLEVFLAALLVAIPLVLFLVPLTLSSRY